MEEELDVVITLTQREASMLDLITTFGLRELVNKKDASGKTVEEGARFSEVLKNNLADDLLEEIFMMLVFDSNRASSEIQGTTLSKLVTKLAGMRRQLKHYDGRDVI